MESSKQVHAKPVSITVESKSGQASSHARQGWNSTRLQHLQLLMREGHVDHVGQGDLAMAGQGRHVGQVASHVCQRLMRVQLAQRAAQPIHALQSCHHVAGDSLHSFKGPQHLHQLADSGWLTLSDTCLLAVQAGRNRTVDFHVE